VVTSCRAKARVVAADERETGERALLNLGHTFGHALEAAGGFGAMLLHGEAIAIGMVLAFELSVRMGLCPAADAARVRRHLAAVGLPTTPPAGANWNADRLMDLIAQDKKVRAGKATFILARGIGQSFVSRDVDPGDVRTLLAQSLAA
jgi:3-dehydroquinate synthase